MVIQTLIVCKRNQTPQYTFKRFSEWFQDSEFTMTTDKLESSTAALVDPKYVETLDKKVSQSRKT